MMHGNRPHEGRHDGRHSDGHGHRGGPGGSSQEKKKYTKFRKDNRCRFCREKIKEVDYKELAVLLKLCTTQGKMYSRKRSGNCTKHQHSSSAAIKRARYLALLPYSGQ